MHYSALMNIPPHDPNLLVPTDGFFDPGASNGFRARSARSAMLHYRDERGFESDETTCAIDLITDLLHYLHSVGEDPFAAVEKAKDYFDAESRGTSLLIVA